MPWTKVNPMDQKVLFLGDYLRGDHAVSVLCERYGISRKTGYKWIGRYQALGLDGLADKARTPHSHPAKTPYAVRKRIIALRKQSRLTPGAKKIQALLASEFEVLPAVSTINKILRQEGLAAKRPPSRRYCRYPNALSKPQAPNDLWSVDFKGQFKLGNGQWCYPLTVMDDVSRHLMGVLAQSTTKTEPTQKAFTRLFKEYGLPRMIRSDNGTPFASRAAAGLSQLSMWWIRLGIYPERIEPGKPQQNGKHERMHRTLKEHTLKPASASMGRQQQRFDAFTEAYNEERPHEALGMNRPSQYYHASSRRYPDTLPALEYPSHYQIKRVGHSGIVYWNNGRGYISHLLAKQDIGLEEVADGVFDVYYSFYKLGRLDTTVPYKGHRDYWPLHV